MAPNQTNGTNGLTKYTSNNFSAYVKQNRGALEAAALEKENLRRLYQLTVTCVSQTPALQQCSISSIFRAMQQAAELALEPGSALGECYLVPYKDTCQLIIGYRGLIALARRSGEVESIQAFCVYEDDAFTVELGIAPVLSHKPAFTDADPRRIRYAYAIARLKGGAIQFDVMTRAEIDAIRNRSRAGTSGPWSTDFAEMAKKTVVRRLVKYLPMSIQMARAVEIDTSSEFGEIDSAVVETPVAGGSDNPLDLDITENNPAEQQTRAAMSR